VVSTALLFSRRSRMGSEYAVLLYGPGDKTTNATIGPGRRRGLTQAPLDRAPPWFRPGVGTPHGGLFSVGSANQVLCGSPTLTQWFLHRSLFLCRRMLVSRKIFVCMKSFVRQSFGDPLHPVATTFPVSAGSIRSGSSTSA